MNRDGVRDEVILVRHLHGAFMRELILILAVGIAAACAFMEGVAVHYGQDLPWWQMLVLFALAAAPMLCYPLLARMWRWFGNDVWRNCTAYVRFLFEERELLPEIDTAIATVVKRHKFLGLYLKRHLWLAGIHAPLLAYKRKFHFRNPWRRARRFGLS